jgi:hypothetical protein
MRPVWIADLSAAGKSGFQTDRAPSLVVVEDRLARALRGDDIADHAVPVTPPELPSGVELRAPTDEGLLDGSLDLLLTRGAGGRGHATNLRVGLAQRRAISAAARQRHRVRFGELVRSHIPASSATSTIRSSARRRRFDPAASGLIVSPSSSRSGFTTSKVVLGQGREATISVHSMQARNHCLPFPLSNG